MAAYAPGDRSGCATADAKGLTFYTRQPVAYMGASATAKFISQPGRWFLLAQRRQVSALLATGQARLLAEHGPYVVLTGP